MMCRAKLVKFEYETKDSMKFRKAEDLCENETECDRLIIVAQIDREIRITTELQIDNEIKTIHAKVRVGVSDYLSVFKTNEIIEHLEDLTETAVNSVKVQLERIVELINELNPAKVEIQL